MEEKEEFLPTMTHDIIASTAQLVNRFYQEVTITKVNGECPYGHKEGDKHRVTATNADSLCGALWQANHSSIACFHYGGSVAWEKKPHIFKGVCPEMGRVQIEVERIAKPDSKHFRTEAIFKDMTGKGFAGTDKYRVFLEVLGVEHHCMWGHRPGQRFEVDPFNIGKVCGFLYWGAYHSISLLFAGESPPWEPEKNIVHGVCPDIYNQTAYHLTREER
jgi:uncharacterized repeat protein (TIGR04076 family)